MFSQDITNKIYDLLEKLHITPIYIVTVFVLVVNYYANRRLKKKQNIDAQDAIWKSQGNFVSVVLIIISIFYFLFNNVF